MATHAGPEQRRQWVLGALERYEAPLVRYVRRLVADEGIVRDVVQHAFLQLCDQSPEDLGGRLAPWLFAVCRNRAVDYLRFRERVRTTSEFEAPARLSRELDPAVAAEQKDLYQRLTQLIESLPAGQREAITLWSEGFSYREIAEIAETTEGNVRVLMHRAIKRLRQHPFARNLAADWQPAESRLAGDAGNKVRV
jgi:RNA polymerase sigma factor (sigma-70 family)